MDGVNYQTLLMMIADAPHYVTRKTRKKEEGATEGKDEVLEFFQSNLKL